jgi:hypothetical protein
LGDEDVGPADERTHVRDRRAGGLQRGQVGRYEPRLLRAGHDQERAGRLTTRRVAPDHDEAGAEGGQCPGALQPDAAGAAGDDDAGSSDDDRCCAQGVLLYRLVRR